MISYAEKIKNHTLHEYDNTGISERNDSFEELVQSGDKDTQEQQYLVLLSKPENCMGLSDSEAAIMLGMPKSERAGARRKGLMDKHEQYFKDKYGVEWKEHFYPLIVKNGRKTNLLTGKANSVWMINHNRETYERL